MATLTPLAAARLKAATPPKPLSARVSVLGAIISWFLFALSFRLAALSLMDVMAVGGSCASGNTPYVIAVECPDTAWIVAPSIFGGVIAVGLSFFAARGFGIPLAAVAWTIMFGSIGLSFGAAGFAEGRVTSIVMSIVFVLMAAVPLLGLLLTNPRRLLIGSTTATGTPFTTPTRSASTVPLVPESPRPAVTVRPTFRDLVTSLAVSVPPALAGWWLAGMWFPTAV